MVEEKGKEETIEIPVGKYFGKMRDNPWMVASIVLGLLFIGSLFFGFSGNAGVTESEVEANVLSFLNSQVEGEVVLDSLNWNDGGYFEMVVSYNGDQIPLYVTANGDKIITDLVDVTGAGSGTPVAPGNTGGKVNFVIPEDAYVKGDANAPVTIVEFSDGECPFCGKFVSEAYQDILTNYINTGKAKLVFMHFPLSFHANAMPAAIALECAGELGGSDGFFEMHDKIFENQQSLNSANYIAWAGELGLDSGFAECLDSGKYDEKINNHLTVGAGVGISGTPGFLIGNEADGFVLVSGAQPFSAFEKIIEGELGN